MSREELCGASQRSNDAIAALTPRVQWQQSYVTADKVDCVYIAEDEAAIVEHAELSGFPANVVSRVAAVIDPTTGEG
jgi:hypothetical protein